MSSRVLTSPVHRNFARAFAWVLLCLFALPQSLWSADAIEAIPLQSTKMPATDLVYPDPLGGARILTPEEAWKLQNQSNPLDLSLLDPDPSTSLWKNTLGAPFPPEETLPTSATPEGILLNYEGGQKSRTGRLRFNVSLTPQSPSGFPSAPKETFTLLLSKRAHTILLMKGLLRKLGYVVPPIQHLHNVRIQFPNEEAKNNFLKLEIPRGTEGAPSRWVVEDPQASNSPLILHLQDVLLMPSRIDYYNLALGVPPEQQRLRILRSLLLVYGLGNLGESVNKFEWTLGRISNGQLLIPHTETNTLFDCSIEDAKWMLRRIARLTRQDFLEITASAHFPPEVAALVTERLISRRNSLLSLIPIEGAAEIAIDTQISSGAQLKEGKLLAQDWKGYASRFSHGEQESPFSDLEYLALGKFESAVIDGLIAKLNDVIPSVDTQGALQKHAEEQFKEKLLKYFETGQLQETPVGVFATPTGSVQTILSRDIVTGNYQGSDSLVQLADTIGFAGSAGVYAIMEGLSAPFRFTGNASLFLARTYTHLKPLNSFKRAVTEPFKNILVPILKLEAAHDLSLFEKLSKFAGLERTPSITKELDAVIQTLNEHLGIGESIIVSQSIGAQAGTALAADILSSFYVSKNLNGRISADLTVGGEGKLVSRIQIYRKNADTIQVYKDNGNYKGFQLGFELKGLIPILTLSYKPKTGTTGTTFYTVTLPTQSNTTEAFSNALALKQVLTHGSTELLAHNVKPYVIKTRFDDASTTLQFLWWKRRGLSASGVINIDTPDQKHARYLRITSGVQSGNNYMNFSVQAANLISSIFLDPTLSPYIRISEVPVPNPGQSLFGNGETITTEFEAEIIEKNKATSQSTFKDTLFRDTMIRLTHRFEGWSMPRAEAQELLDRLMKDYDFSFYPKAILADIDILKLYNVQVSVNIYGPGIQLLTQDPKDDIQDNRRRMLQRYFEEFHCEERFDRSAPPYIEQVKCGALRRYAKQLKNFKKLTLKGKPAPLGELTVEMVETLLKLLNFRDFVEFIGGRENLFVFGKINGFRSGAEANSEPILSNTFGRIGSKKWNGSLETVRSIMGIQEGEFNGTWLRDFL